MEVRNNYNECLTNLACSIRKYFELDYKHNTLSYIDEILETKKPENVVLILLDGMGSRIVNRTLDNDSFLRKYMYKEITTVFPATTTAATTSIRTGLNPKEHGWLGWNTYLKPIDKVVTLFMKKEKTNEETSIDIIDKGMEQLVKDTITSEINKENKYYARELFPFGDNPYNDLDDMLSSIYNECSKKGKKFIYAYDTEPDYTMHDLGSDSEQVKKLIRERNNKIEKLCNNLTNTLVIIVADHGHTNVNTIKLEEYKDIYNLLDRTTSIEPRATSYKIKEGYKEEFVSLFNKEFGEDFKLYTKEDVINSNLFGDGEPNPLFEDALGDYISIAYKDKAIIADGDHDLYSMHAGYTDDEIMIPVIIKECSL